MILIWKTPIIINLQQCHIVFKEENAYIKIFNQQHQDLQYHKILL